MINKCNSRCNSNCYPNTNCRICNNLVISTSVAISGTEMVITIPQATYTNNQKLCILIAQTLPVSTTPLPVTIQINGSETTIPFRTICGHNVYSDQLRTRTIYPVYAATDSQTFVYRLKERCLPCTNYAFSDTIPPATTSASATLNVTEKSSK